MSAEYRVQIFAFANTTTFGVGALVAELELAKYIGYADYLNDVPEAFFSLNQEDPKLASLMSYVGRSHIRILRNDQIVWTGWLMDSDESEEDVIFYGYGYTAGLFWSVTDWNQTFIKQQIGQIVSALWTRAKSGLSQSTLGFVTTGTIEAPVTTTGGATPIQLELYTAYHKIILYAMRELAALSIANTGNTVVFEITHSATPTFNLWKDRGAQKPNALLEYGNQILRFRRQRSLVYRRNDLYVVGAAPHNLVLRSNPNDTADFNTWGRRMGSTFFSWARDETELSRAASRRLTLAKREDSDLRLSLKANSVVPPGASGSLFILGDEIPVRINKGVTQINGTYFQVVGHQTIAMRGVEVVHLLLQEPVA